MSQQIKRLQGQLEKANNEKNGQEASASASASSTSPSTSTSNGAGTRKRKLAAENASKASQRTLGDEEDDGDDDDISFVGEFVKAKKAKAVVEIEDEDEEDNLLTSDDNLHRWSDEKNTARYCRKEEVMNVWSQARRMNRVLKEKEHLLSDHNLEVKHNIY